MHPVQEHVNTLRIDCLIQRLIGYIEYEKRNSFPTQGVRIKGTNGRQKTYEIFHVYCVFYSGFMCQTTVIFGITKDGSLVLTT